MKVLVFVCVCVYMCVCLMFYDLLVCNIHCVVAFAASTGVLRGWRNTVEILIELF